MPYPNEHAARLHPPEKYKEFRRFHPPGFPKGVDAILGIKEEGGGSEIQAIRAKREVMSLSEFKRWLSANDFSPMMVEEATEMQKSIELFSTWSALDLVKGPNGTDDAGENVKISGIISTDTVDLQGDTILQEGMDFSYFVKRGWLNWEHQQGPENVLGYPTAVKAVEHAGKNATYIEGELLIDKPRVKEIVETVKALSKSKSGRTMGFSVEGQVLQRDPKNPKIITKSRILNVSITSHPVNPDSTLELLARSLMATEKHIEKAHVAATAVAEHVMRMHPELSSNKEVLMELLRLIDKQGGYGEEKGYSWEKAAEVGYQTPAVASGGISALVPQSSAGASSNASYGKDEEEEDDDESMDSMDGEESMDESMDKPSIDEHIKDALRRVLASEMGKMMQAEVEKMMSPPTDGEQKQKPLISNTQMYNVVAKVLPGLPQSAQKDFARKLLSAAKLY